jgi:predicted AAA+ superfamily ATPase
MVTWRPGPEDLERVFEEQNPWHRIGRVPDVLAPPVERPLARDLWRVLAGDRLERYQLVLGPRRVGKTTAMYQTVRHLLAEGVDPRRLWWLRVDHPLLLREDLGQLVRSVLDDASGDDHPTTLFLDELVYARDWDLWLKTFFDDRWPVRIVATSSASAALRHRRLESGVGRWTEQYLTPYLFTEFLDLVEHGVQVEVAADLGETIERLPNRTPNETTIESLRRRYLILGGFPELLDADRGRTDDGDDVARLLQSQQVLRSDAVERAVYKDIPQSFGVDNPMMLERLLYVLAGQATGVLSPTRICQELDGLSQPTFDRYLSYLERAFLVFTLPNYSGRESTVQKRGRKLYFVDGAVRNAALQRGVAPLDDPIELGMLIENLVAATLHSLATLGGLRLFHWRDGGSEVDLVLDHPTHPLAFEVGSSPDHSRNGLRALMARYPRFEGRCYLVTPRGRAVLPTSSPTGIGTLPLDLLLIAAGRQAEAALAARLP